MIEELHAIVAQQPMGVVRWDRKRNLLGFYYSKEWRESSSSFPLSMSMPLASSEHRHEVVAAFLWGLLPDNRAVLDQWGKKFQVSSGNVFRLLWHVGEECAGAVQFVRPDRRELFIGKRGQESDHIRYLNPCEMEERMSLLLDDQSATRISGDTGQFSLAGAQPKTALHFAPSTNRWGVPDGSIPTTHILKPATGHWKGYAENEHFCLKLAEQIGLPVAQSRVEVFDKIHVIIVERFDRYRVADVVQRIHQEDACQALGVHPNIKYQNEGGPSAKDILTLIRENSSDSQIDEGKFIDALILNWLISGTDAHAKNYSFLIAEGGQVRLAPLYDISSSLPYPQSVDPRKARLAMRIGKKYKVNEIGAYDWEKSAAEWGCDRDGITARIQQIAGQVPEAARCVAEDLQSAGIDHEIVMDLAGRVEERSVRYL